MKEHIKKHPLLLYPLLFVGGLALTLLALACAVGNTGFSAPSLADEAYAVCATGTPIPTEVFTFLIGTSTPIPSTTPPLGIGTPIFGTGFTTPVPTETPYYRVESFYIDQIVHLAGVTIELMSWSQAPDPDYDNMDLHTFTFRIGNHIGDGQIFALSQYLFIRRVTTVDNQILIGRWTANPEHVGNIELQPMARDEKREYSIPIRAPKGQITELGLVSSWQSQLVGGVPIWFIPEPDTSNCGFWWVDWQLGPPPRPTPSIIGVGSGGYGSGGTGVCGWPVAGTLVRGFGCSAFATGITDPMGCADPIPYFHNGLDISAPIGTAIVAPVNGRIATGYDDVRGNYVQVINDTMAERHDLLHMDSVFVVDGQDIPAGQAVGTVGNTGNSTGPHLHWTIRRNLIAVDPATWGGCTAEEPLNGLANSD